MNALLMHRPRSMTRTFLLAVMLSVAVVLLAVVLGATPAWAAGDPVASREGSVLTVDSTTWSLLQGLAVPLLVGLVTRASATSRVKVLVQLLINALGALFAAFYVLDGVAVLSSSTFVNWMISTVTTIALHYGLWKPIGVTGSSPSVGVLLPDVGIGSPADTGGPNALAVGDTANGPVPLDGH